MDLATRKYQFIEKFINSINDDRIELFESLLALQSDENDLVAFSVSGEPLTKEEYTRQIKDAEKDIAEGRFKTVSDLEKEVKNW
ncbi:MAG: hypothetical protein QM564_00735 [Bergeyella sp.]